MTFCGWRSIIILPLFLIKAIMRSMIRHIIELNRMTTKYVNGNMKCIIIIEGSLDVCLQFAIYISQLL